MKLKLPLAVLFVFILFVSASAKDFSAEMVSTMKGEKPAAGKFFSSGDRKFRMEMKDAVVITRLDKKLVWILMPAEKLYMEQPVRPENVVAGETYPGETERKFLGTEAVEGRAAKKYKVSYRIDGRTESVYQWMDDSLGLALKTADVNGKWSVLFRDVKVAPQPPGLFELPGGYQKMQMGMPSGDFGDPAEEGEFEEADEPYEDPAPKQQKKGLPGGIKLPKVW